MEKTTFYQICNLGVWDSTIPGIKFDELGISNYAKIQQTLMQSYPRGQKGTADWESIVEKVKAMGRGRKYDCIVGVSGGVDSSYLLFLIKNIYGLRPLAVTLDNGWSSSVAVNNIKLMTENLEIDLETHVIEYEEIKDMLRSYMFACLPWIDTPTDIAIKGLMYKVALREGIKYIFRGNDFRTEGKQPREWTYSDDKQLRYIHQKYGKLHKLRTYPYLSFSKIIYSSFVKNIKEIRPYYYLEYSKLKAREFLEKEYGWQYYGGHHHENIYTKFVMSVWLPEKFGIDKRKINLSAQVLSGEITRDYALKELHKPALTVEKKDEIISYVLKKLDLTKAEYQTILSQPNKTYQDYPNYEKLLFILLRYFSPLIKTVYVQKPMTFVEMEYNKNV